MANSLTPAGTDGLHVSIAVHDSPDSLHALERNGVPLLHAVVRNVSDGPLSIWAEDCSAGNASLTLEVLALEGAVLSEPVVVHRGPSVWLRNIIRRVTLEPGEVTVRPIRLHQYQEGQRSAPIVWSDHTHYVGFPVLASSYGYAVRMRAVFTSGGDERARADGLWVGRVASEARDYRVWGVYW